RYVVESSGDHPDLRSFPTRRSSDLAVAWNGLPRASRPEGCGVRARCRKVGSIGLARAILAVRPAPSRIRDMKFLCPSCSAKYQRSEEHTSELQSRENLVCRLLLEKK